jgi:RhtB (resistance to homoserine/threonine) family protein
MNSFYLAQFFTVAFVHFLAVASPGPDFLIVTKNSLSQGRKAGVYTSIGVALGIGVHVTYCMLGIGLIISQSILIFSIIKYLGAAYLIWIGIKGLRARKKAVQGFEKEIQAIENAETQVEQKSNMINIKTGFLVNALNPKATIFFLALFTQVIDPATPLFIKGLYGVETIAATFVWFSIVSVAFSNKHMKEKITRIEHWIDRTAGAVLVALGIKVALSDK